MACILSFARFPAKNRPSKHERVYASSPSPFHINNYIAKKPRANNRLSTVTTFFSIASLPQQGRAMRWWNSVKDNPIPDQNQNQDKDQNQDQDPWGHFKPMFEKRYITAVQKSVLFQKFADLRQGGMSVSDYVTEFETLSKYGPSLINNEVKKNQKFVMGLNDPLREMLLNHINETFENLMEKALRHESLYPKPKSVVARNEEPKSQARGRGKKKWNNNKKQQLQINAGQKKGSTGAGAFVTRKIVDIADKDQVVDGSDCEIKGHEFEPQN